MIRVGIALVCLTLLAAVVLAAPAKYDVLIVADLSKPDQRAKEKALRLALEKERALAGVSSQELPIDTYDVSRPGMRAAVDRLGIGPGVLPYVAVCTLNATSGRPARVVTGLGPVGPIPEAVRKVLAEGLRRYRSHCRPFPFRFPNFTIALAKSPTAS